MITEMQDEFAEDLAWGTTMDERMIQADFDDEDFEDRPRDFDIVEDYRRTPCGDPFCDCPW